MTSSLRTSGPGTFAILAPTWDFSSQPGGAPAALSIRGNVNTAIPEPGSLALVAAGFAPLGLLAYRRRLRVDGPADRA